MVVGPVQGHLRSAFGKLSRLQKKQDFSLCIVVGDVFGDGSIEGQAEELDELLNGSLEVPLQTYFIVGDLPLPEKVIEKLEANDEDQVCTNLSYLGRKGTYKTSDGIRIVFVGGKLVQNETSVISSPGKYDPLYLAKDASVLFGAHSTDILISNQWPANITSGSSNAVPEHLRTDQGVQCLAELCQKLKPRYHFSSSLDAFWEREPFQHPVDYGSFDTVGPCTRFMSLGGVKGPSKEWFSAFKLDPSNVPPPSSNTTTTPFTRGRKRSADTGQINGNPRYSDGYQRERPQKRPREDCFMCFRNMKQNAGEHLVSAIGEDSVLTIPRGPLPLPSSFPQLAWSGHVLIIPHYHAADEGMSGPREQADIDKEFAEMTKFREALCKMVSTVSKGALGAVCWDTNRTGIRHMHWQWMAVPVKLIKDGLLEGAFKVLGEQNKCPLFEVADADGLLPVRSDYFRLWIYTPPEQDSNPLSAADRLSGDGDADEGSEKCMYFPLPSNQRFNIWFAREAMAKLLNLSNRLKWMDVQQSMEEEQEENVAFREQFAPWDFTLIEEAGPVDGEIG